MSDQILAADLRDDFLDSCRHMVDYWARIEDRSTHDKLSGLLHSVLTLIDGCNAGFPCALDLVARPHPDDKAYSIENDEDWVEDGTVLNENDMLHELLYHRGSWATRRPDTPGPVIWGDGHRDR